MKTNKETKKVLDENVLKLIYILNIGQSYNESNIYEFLFSDDIDNIEIDEWGWELNANNAESIPPEKDYVKHSIRIETDEILLDVLHKNEYFTYLDGYYGIIALAWENLEAYEEHEDNYSRMVFKYGETLKQVQDKFYARDININ